MERANVMLCQSLFLRFRTAQGLELQLKADPLLSVDDSPEFRARLKAVLV
jgi:hypothetical protein